MKIKQIVVSLKQKRVSKRRIFLMKLSFTIYLVCCFQLMAFTSFSQNKVSLKVENSSLQAILSQIESQTKFNFVYNNDEIDGNLKFSIDVLEKDITSTLDLLFNNTEIHYKLRKNLVILSNRKSQNKSYTISGTIKDAATGETLLGANIIVVGENKGTTTNEYGFYSLTLPQGNYTLQISYLGYTSINNILELNDDIKLNFELQPSSNVLDEVVVISDTKNKSQVRNILSGVNNLKVADIKQLPAFFGEPDINRAILTQPGVTSVGEGTSGFNVRGGNIDQNLTLLDEAPLYVSSHLWGLFSVVNADAIKDITLYKGGIPARYGGRASSVLDIRQKEGNSKVFKGEGGLGTLFSRVTLEGPIVKEKLNFLVSGRRSYFDLFFPLIGGDIENSKVFFYDLNTKLSWNINENNKLFASGYFGADVMKLDDTASASEPNEPNEPDASIDFRWKNATATLRWNHLFSDKLFMNLSGIYSSYAYSLVSQNDSGGFINGAGTFKWNSGVENWIVKPDFTYYTNPNTKMRFGINGTLYKFNPAKLSSSEAGLSPKKFNIDKGLEIAPYYEIEKTWDKLSLNFGLRYSWFGNIGPNTVTLYNPDFPLTINTITDIKKYKKGEIIKSYSGFEPRLSLKYGLNDRKALKLGYNRTFQYIHLISNTAAALPFDIWKPSGTHIKPLEVNQISGGYAYDTPNKRYNVTVDGYYKTFKNFVEYKNGADLFINKNIETQLLPAEGYAYGLELGIYKNRGKLTGNFNYTYSVSKRKTTSKFNAENINNGAYYPSNYDRPHLLNITANYNLGKRWDIGIFFTYQTGRPSTVPTGRLTFDGNPYLTYSDRNAFRIPDTHRMDISFTYKPTGNPNTKWQSSWNFGLYNVYGSPNAFSVFSTFQNNELKTFKFSVLGAPIPFIAYNFKF
ncbi:TonB-dependent receptor [Flavobacterium litorale]|uniref:TonB-dependent receptor n=1 Tax=Flavobacterium litorale TaxID=2856519 RepID=A0ABX8V8E1_9FLAO|nr:TonB-dependent receptor [Flavobacterium litorale]QYJ68393.1 TonB-dependent receptor [Flavobacterium litorale]